MTEVEKIMSSTKTISENIKANYTLEKPLYSSVTKYLSKKEIKIASHYATTFIILMNP